MRGKHGHAKNGGKLIKIVKNLGGKIGGNSKI